MRIRGLKTAIALVAIAGFHSGCATAPKKDYSAFRSADPRSILVVPVVNNSVDVNASEYFLSTLSIPIAERGFYVFPVNMVKRLLEDDGLSDAALVHNAEAARLCSLFGSDAVLYATIDRWDAKYMVLSTQVTVEFDYKLKDCKTGNVLWEERRQKVYVPDSGRSSGSPLATLVGMALNAALTKAMPNYMPLARQANAESFAYPGPGIPAGPYHKDYRKDVETSTSK